jgi:hypothetical protein
MPRKKKKEGDPEVHGDLKGFDIRINEFGEIISTFDVEKLNTFLNENTEDKKLSDAKTEEEE